jgi:hypothetical protein
MKCYAWGLFATVAAGCTDRGSVGQAGTSARSGAPAADASVTATPERYELVSSHGARLPYSGEDRDSAGAPCVVTLRSAAYEVAAGRWRRTHEVESTCAGGRKELGNAPGTYVDSGYFSQTGDTAVTFEAWDERMQQRVIAHEGTRHGDTLRLGGPDNSGPPEVYVRRRP